jgi:hypothetical protein
MHLGVLAHQPHRLLKIRPPRIDPLAAVSSLRHSIDLTRREVSWGPYRRPSKRRKSHTHKWVFETKVLNYLSPTPLPPCGYPLRLPTRPILGGGRREASPDRTQLTPTPRIRHNSTLLPTPQSSSLSHPDLARSRSANLPGGVPVESIHSDSDFFISPIISHLLEIPPEDE